MKWRSWIKKYGIKKVATECNISYEAVRKWLKGINEPSKSNMLKIIKLSNGEITLNDFFSRNSMRKENSI